MKTITLSRGAIALVDNEDFGTLNRYKWYLNSEGYACRTIWYGRDKTPKHKNVYMHRRILGLTDRNVLVDHINANRVDNRRANLRYSTKSTNGCNRGKTRTNTSGYKGVSKHTQCNRWVAQIRAKNKHHYLGLFENAEDAARAYNAAALMHFGKHACLNDV